VSDYDTDFYQWTRRQTALLAERRWDQLGVEHLIEEVRSLGDEQAHAVETQARHLLTHLLMWRYQPVRRKPRWRRRIRHARDEIDDRLRRNPSLRGELEDAVARQYPKARRMAVDETGLPPATFPESCPWAVERVLDQDCWPEGR
jgi:hypothetical protein